MATRSGGIKELEAYMLDICKKAAEKIGDDVKELIKDFIMVYYSEYSPVQYSRTYQFLDSVTRTKAVKDGSGYKVYVYLEDDGIDYKKVEPIDVWNMANMGVHGGVLINGTKDNPLPSDNHFWDDAMEMLDKGYIKEKFGEYLKSKGLNVNISH